MTPLYISLTLLLLVVCVLLATGCAGSSSDQTPMGDVPLFIDGKGFSVFASPTIPQDKYVFLEHRINTNGTSIIGDCCGGNALDFPFYYFEKKGVLTLLGSRNKIINESLKMFYGDGESLSGCAGGGANTWASPVYSLPYTQKNVTIESIFGDGTVSLRYDQKQISLKPNGEWSVNTTRYENISRIYEDRPGRFIRVNCTKKLVTTDSIYNSGFLDKGTIVFG